MMRLCLPLALNRTLFPRGRPLRSLYHDCSLSMRINGVHLCLWHTMVQCGCTMTLQRNGFLFPAHQRSGLVIVVNTLLTTAEPQLIIGGGMMIIDGSMSPAVAFFSDGFRPALVAPLMIRARTLCHHRIWASGPGSGHRKCHESTNTRSQGMTLVF